MAHWAWDRRCLLPTVTPQPAVEVHAQGQSSEIVVKASSVACLHFDGLVNKEFTASKAVSKIVLNF